MLNDVELQARIDNFLHRKEEQFPELAQKSNATERLNNGDLTALRLGARPSN